MPHIQNLPYGPNPYAFLPTLVEPLVLNINGSTVLEALYSNCSILNKSLHVKISFNKTLA